jgi:large subunit ribosomal protein L21
MYAILETGGKQYRVSEGDVLSVEKLKAESGETVEFTNILGFSREGKFTVGTPYVPGVKVVAKVLEHGKNKKVVIFKYLPKKDHRKKKGHRQPFTKLLIEKIEA